MGKGKPELDLSDRPPESTGANSDERLTYADVGAEPAGAVATAIARHEAHPNHLQFAPAAHAHPQYATLADIQSQRALTSAAIILNSSWVSSASVQCFRLSSGIVFLEGLVSRSSGKASQGEIIAVLPLEFRPRISQKFRVVDGSVGASLSNSNPFIEINPITGEIRYGNSGSIPSSTLSLSFGGVFFLAAAT